MITKSDYGKSTSKLLCLWKCEYLVKFSAKMNAISLRIMIYRHKSTKKRIKRYSIQLYLKYRPVLNWTAKITRIVSRLGALECTCSPYFSIVSKVLRSATFILVAGIWFGGRCFAGGEIERFERRVDAQKSFTKSVKHLFDLREYTSS